MKGLAYVIAAALVASASPAMACTPIAFGKFAVGQRVPHSRFVGIPGSCVASNECTYNERSGIEYVVIRDVVVDVSAPVRIIRGLPMPARRIDAAYARRVNRRSCHSFRLKREEGGDAYLETAERIDPVSRQPVRTVIAFDERRTPLVSFTSLPDN